MDRPIVVLDTETANVRGAPFLLELGAVRVVEGEVVECVAQLRTMAVVDATPHPRFFNRGNPILNG